MWRGGKQDEKIEKKKDSMLVWNVLIWKVEKVSMRDYWLCKTIEIRGVAKDVKFGQKKKKRYVNVNMIFYWSKKFYCVHKIWKTKRIRQSNCRSNLSKTTSTTIKILNFFLWTPQTLIYALSIPWIMIVL